MTLRLAHLSDIHFGGENKDAVAAAAGWIVAHRPDLTVITGDITREGAPAEFAAARAWVDGLARCYAARAHELGARAEELTVGRVIRLPEA